MYRSLGPRQLSPYLRDIPDAKDKAIQRMLDEIAVLEAQHPNFCLLNDQMASVESAYSLLLDEKEREDKTYRYSVNVISVIKSNNRNSRFFNAGPISKVLQFRSVMPVFRVSQYKGTKNDSAKQLMLTATRLTPWKDKFPQQGTPRLSRKIYSQNSRHN